MTGSRGKIGHLPWDDYPPIPVPDQRRYGPGPTGPTVPEDPRPPRWEVIAIDAGGGELHRCIVNGYEELDYELRSVEGRADFGWAWARPLRVRRSA